MTVDPEAFLNALLTAAIDAADPAYCVPKNLPAPPKGRTIVIGAGKAAAKMARVIEETWEGPLEGTVVTRYGHRVDCDRIEVIEAAHPVPDAAGEAGARKIRALAADAGADDLVLCLMSGGASATCSSISSPRGVEVPWAWRSARALGASPALRSAACMAR